MVAKICRRRKIALVFEVVWVPSGNKNCPEWGRRRWWPVGVMGAGSIDSLIGLFVGNETGWGRGVDGVCSTVARAAVGGYGPNDVSEATAD